MKKYTLKITFLIFFLSLSYSAISQKIENIRREIKDGEVTIHYDLFGADTSQIFEIRLYSIIDNYKQRLYRGVGDVGRDVKPGINKKITWNNKEELTAYRITDMDFDLEASLIYSPVLFVTPSANSRFKRGNVIKVDWIGGENFEKIRLELFQNNIKLRTIGNVPNRGTYAWRIPSNIAPEQGYQIKIIREGKSDEGVLSPKFRIERRIPTVYKIIPVAAVGVAGLTYAIISVINGGGGGEQDEVLPPPINPQ